MTQTVSTAHCPICGVSNNCVMADGQPQGKPCWCFDAEFSAEVLAMIPDKARGVACVCKTCAEKYRPEIT